MPTDTLTDTVVVKMVSESGSAHFKLNVNGVQKFDLVPSGAYGRVAFSGEKPYPFGVKRSA